MDGVSVYDLFGEEIGLTYDDFIVLPGYINFHWKDVDLETKFTKNRNIGLPFISSPMDTVTGSELAIALGKLGGVGIIHYNCTIAEQVAMVTEVVNAGLLPSAAVSTRDEDRNRINRLYMVSGGNIVFVIDSAQGDSIYQLKTIEHIKKNYPYADVIAGNVVTYMGASRLIKAGADALRVGMGAGSICTTQDVMAVGRAQAIAVYSVRNAASSARPEIPVIADGGISNFGHISKALVCGADSVMMGFMFAGTNEALSGTKYRGMASLSALGEGGEKRYGTNKETILVPQGVEGEVNKSGTVAELIAKMSTALQQSLQDMGCNSIKQIMVKQKLSNLRVERRSLAARIEGSPHDIRQTMP